eukprot:6213797-Pleurochrysis_carterae.AAC.2
MRAGCWLCLKGTSAVNAKHTPGESVVKRSLCSQQGMPNVGHVWSLRNHFPDAKGRLAGVPAIDLLQLQGTDTSRRARARACLGFLSHSLILSIPVRVHVLANPRTHERVGQREGIEAGHGKAEHEDPSCGQLWTRSW